MSSFFKKNDKVYICFSPAGFGLRKDAEILRDTLAHCGYAVAFREEALDKNRKTIIGFLLSFCEKFNLIYLIKIFQRLIFFTPKPTYIHLENISYPVLLRYGNHLLIPNQEWFRPATISWLPYLRAVWCKTHLAQGVFDELGVKTDYIGFCTSLMTEINSDHGERKSEFVSRVGISALRGVHALVLAWSSHPHWPMLHIVVHPSRRIYPAPANISYVDEFVTAHDYRQFANQFRFQIFATETEGFGHSIFEAVESGALVLVTDAPPMNEQLNASIVININACYSGQKGLSPRFSVTQDGLDQAINYALRLNDCEVLAYQERGRHLIQSMHSEFLNNLRLALNKLG